MGVFVGMVTVSYQTKLARMGIEEQLIVRHTDKLEHQETTEQMQVRRENQHRHKPEPYKWDPLDWKGKGHVGTKLEPGTVGKSDWMIWGVVWETDIKLKLRRRNRPD